VLYVTLPPEAVDINVHPSKAEVRFVESGAVHGLIERGIRLTLTDAPWTGMASASADASVTPENDELPLFSPEPGAPPLPASQPPRHFQPFQPPAASPLPGASPPGVPVYRGLPPVSPGLEPPAPEGGFFASLDVLGQLGGRYILAQDDSGLHLVDQHAAHQRMLYEEALSCFTAGEVRAQRLLFPLQVVLPAELAQAATEHRDALLLMGYDVEPFGGDDWVVGAVPAMLAERDPLLALRAVLERLPLRRSGAPLQDAELSAVLAALSCHAALQPGEVLEVQQCRDLLSRLDGAPMEASCAHGGHVLVTRPLAEVARWFQRR
jgi:DNA mismatch repair protein MutL